MNIVEAFLQQDIPSELWHYTTMEGFEGMVTSGAIWASEVRSSRDQTEFVHARSVAEAYLARLLPTDEYTARGIQTAKDLVAEVFDIGWLSQRKTEIFIASFSSAPDRKSQWVDYAAGGQGVAVIFDLRNVRPPISLGSAVTLAPCVYFNAKKEELVQCALEHIIGAVRDGFQSADSLVWTRQQLNDWRRVDAIFNEPFDIKAFKKKLQSELTLKARHGVGLFSVDLFRIASHCKHEGYFEENEWRLSLPHTKGAPFIYSEIKYRGPKAIPYVEHHISGVPQLPIVRVVAGFTCRQVERIEMALKNNGYAVHVGKSQLPESR